MSKNITIAQKVSEVRKKQMGSKQDRPETLSEEQFIGLLANYYKEAEESNFYCSLDEAIEKKSYYFLEPQRLIAECILRSVFQQVRHDIFISIVRQFGKTQVVAMTIEFCFRHYNEIFGRPLAVAIIAPERGTAAEVFNRVKNYIIANETELLVDSKYEVKTIAGDTIRLYGIYEGAVGGTIEGRTFDITIRDEAHLGDDAKYIDQVIPATNRTSGPNILIGNGGFRDCYYYNGLKKGTNAKKKHFVFRYTYTKLRDYMMELAGQGLKSAALWVSNTDKYIENMGGKNSMFVRKNIFCEWPLLIGEFLTVDILNKVPPVETADLSTEYLLAYDVAHSGMDRAVATIYDRNKNVLDIWVIKDVGEIMPLSLQAQKLYERCMEAGLLLRDANVKSPLKAIGVDATGLGIGMAEVLESLFPCPIKRFVFSTRPKMEWYITFRDSVVSDIPAEQVRFNTNRVPYANIVTPWATKELWEIAIKEIADIEVIKNKDGTLGFHAPTSRGGVLGKSINDDIVDSMVIGVSLLGYWDGFHPFTRRQASTARSGATSLSMSDVAGLPTYRKPSPGERPGSGVPPKLRELRRLAKKGVDPYASR